MNRVLLADVLAQPWRNGHGLTRELLAWPGAADWVLRVSVATVARDCGFSAFAGVTRWFAVVSGAGVWLDLPGGAVQATAQGAPLCFDGALAPACRLVDGPTQDLNLMGQTAAGSCHLQRAQPVQPAQRAQPVQGTRRAQATQPSQGTQPAHQAQPAAAAGPGIAGIAGSTAWRALYAAQAVQLSVDGTPHAVAAGTLLWCDRPRPSSWRLLPGANAAAAPQAWWLTWAP